MNQVRLSSLCCSQFMRARLPQLVVATLEISSHTLSLSEFHENLCNSIEYENLRLPSALAEQNL